MTEEIKIKLEALLRDHPELKHTYVQFSDKEVVLKDQQAGFMLTKELPFCKNEATAPDVISGPSFKIEVRKSPVHGLGVFAKEKILAGELIEQSKLLKLGYRQKAQHDEVINDYVWGNRSCTCEECQAYGVNQYIALGFGSLYNHADQPNTNKKLDFPRQIITFTAAVDIEAGSEIFTHYGGRYWLLRDFWKNVNQNQEMAKQGFGIQNK